MSEHQIVTPRRNFLIRALGFTAVAAGATVSQPPSATALPPLTGPITPDQYIAEMLAIGWEPYAIVQTLRTGKKIALKGTFESFAPNFNPTEDQTLRRYRLLKAVGESGIDFYDRTGARIHELGMVRHD
jgi:hypothetical protein